MVMSNGYQAKSFLRPQRHSEKVKMADLTGMSTFLNILRWYAQMDFTPMLSLLRL